MTKFVNILLCQQIDGRNRAGFVASARFLVPICHQIARARKFCSNLCQISIQSA